MIKSKPLIFILFLSFSACGSSNPPLFTTDGVIDTLPSDTYETAPVDSVTDDVSDVLAEITGDVLETGSANDVEVFQADAFHDGHDGFAVTDENEAADSASDTPPDTVTKECVTSIPCVGNEDCALGHHCNLLLYPPMCQLLYCGEVGSTCSEEGLCESHYCENDICIKCLPDCGTLKCGLDPVCGESCGICTANYLCESGECVCTPDFFNCECGVDPICGQPCGDCVEGSGCAQNRCVPEGMAIVPSGDFLMTAENIPTPMNYDYFIDIHEVTVDEYFKYLDGIEGHLPVCWPRCPWDNDSSPDKFQHPVSYITLQLASDYCLAVGKRLPTAKEWEKAARGTDGRVYPWGNETATCDYAVMNNYPVEGGGSGCGTGKTWAFCSKSPSGNSPYSLCDMAGNVAEWVSEGMGRGGHSGNRADQLYSYLPGISFTSFSGVGFRCVKANL